MSFFNDAQKDALFGGRYICRVCGAEMQFEDENEDILICLECGHSEESDRYGMSDDEYDALYPTREEVFGYDDEDEYAGETYEEVYDELSDD